MTRPRDSQRSRVYAAENAWLADRAVDAYPTIADVERYVRNVVVIARNPYLPDLCVVGDGRGRRRAGGDRHGIYLPKWSRNEPVILHELAHTITDRRLGARAPWHGWEFCATLLDLVSAMMGARAADALAAEFRARKVRYRAPRTRTTPLPDSDAARAARERFAAAARERSAAAAERRAAAAREAEARADLLTDEAVIVVWFSDRYVVPRATARSVPQNAPDAWGLSRSPRAAIIFPSEDAARDAFRDATGRDLPAVYSTRPARAALDRYESRLASRRAACAS